MEDKVYLPSSLNGLVRIWFLWGGELSGSNFDSLDFLSGSVIESIFGVRPSLELLGITGGDRRAVIPCPVGVLQDS